MKRKVDCFSRRNPRRNIPRPSAWVPANLDLSADTSSASDAIDMSQTPYLVDPLDFWARPQGGKMTCVAVEQTGKSSVWKWGLVWRAQFNPKPTLIVYPSDQDAQDSNRDSFEPLLRTIPEFDDALDVRGKRRKDSFVLPGGTIYFTGGGADIISKPLGVVVGDEVDFWIQHQTRVDNIRNLDKRGRTFSDAVRVLVCSPTEESAPIWSQFQQSSQGYWHLRCLGCNELSMRSCDVHNLNWEREGELGLKAGSLRLKCPSCGHEHEESSKREMNLRGGFIHRCPELLERHVGFQWGALASQRKSLDWAEIATAQMRAGRSGDLKDQKYFDNSIRGVPFSPRASNDTELERLKKHCVPIPSPDVIRYRYMGIDSQEDHFWYVVRGFDHLGNSWLLDYGKAQTLVDLDAAAQKNMVGFGIIDVGGHRSGEIMPWVMAKKFFYAYKGGLQQSRWEYSKNIPKLILGNALLYQSELLHKIHSKADVQVGKWLLPNELTEEYSAQILDLKPNKKARTGYEYRNWVGSGNDHLFDCEKMVLILKDLHQYIIGKTALNTDNRKPKEGQRNG